MSTEEQACIEASLHHLSIWAAIFKLDKAGLVGLENLIIRCLQLAYRKGREEGYRRALGNMPQPKGQ